MQRFLHPLALFASILLLAGLVGTLFVNGIANAAVCLDGCSSGVSYLRVRLALLFLVPGLLLGVAAWDIAMTTLALWRAWRALGALLGTPLLVWIVLIVIAPAIPTVGVGRLDNAHDNGLLVALEAGALTLWVLTSILFILPTKPRPEAITAAG